MVQAYAAMDPHREPAAVVLVLATFFVATAILVVVVSCSQISQSQYFSSAVIEAD
jgi:predicted PurR-regulated permease PerM